MVGASALTAISVAVAALRKAGVTDKVAIRKAIQETNLEASTGNVAFNALGEIKKDVQIQVVKNGNWRHHSIIKDPKLLAPPNK